MNKLNSKCGGCHKLFSWVNSPICAMIPCNHLKHIACRDNNICPSCNNPYTDIITLETADKHSQIYHDIKSMSLNYAYAFSWSYYIYHLPNMLDDITKFVMINDKAQADIIANNMFNNMNIKITTHNEHIINNVRGPRIYICNHISDVDGLFIWYVTRCGALVSSKVINTFMGKKVSQFMPLLAIDRGQNKNTVEAIKSYLKSNDSIVIFPEGMVHHPDYLIDFRTGAFYCDVPIIPIVLHIDGLATFPIDVPHHNIAWLYSQHQKHISLTFCEPQYPPFTSANIEYTRNIMAHTGQLALSRVSSRDGAD